MGTQSFGILIAEDEAEIRTLMAFLFERENFKVFQAVDGTSALETFTTHSEEIALVVTDLGLPGLGGIELIEHVHRLRPSVKIIGTSGFGHSEVREDIIRSGGHEFVPKPFDVMELIRLSKNLLDHQ